MSEEEVLNTLSDLGLTRLDSKIYIYLAKKGPQKGKEISKTLKVQKQQLYRSIKKMQKKAIVSATLESPARFSAVSFEKVLDLFIRAKLEEARKIQQEKSKLLSSWQAIHVGETPDASAKFMVVEGRKIIYSKIKQMINETKSHFLIISTVTGLIHADQFGLLDSNFDNNISPNVQFRLLTHLTENNVGSMKALLNEISSSELRFEIRNPSLGSRLFPRMVIRDQEEVIFFIDPKVDGSIQDQDNLCLWTNCKSLIDSFSALFQELWRNSINVKQKIAEIETGTPLLKTIVISDPDEIKKIYNKKMSSARIEIMILTSSKGLTEFLKKISQLKIWNKKGIKVKIMAPIVKENWNAMKQLSKFCTIKHIPTHYLETIIFDGEHLFQFKMQNSNQETCKQSTRFDNASYTNNPKWVKMINTALKDIWKSAQTPSPSTLESIIGSQEYPLFPLPNNDLRTKIDFKITDSKPPGSITEKEVLNKIIHAKKILAKDPFKDMSRGYGCSAVGAIHPPDQFNLPDMLIQASRHDKQSSFGEEDTIIVYLWLRTSNGQVYVPVAVAGDNPAGQNIWKAIYTGTPAEKNIQLLKKDQIYIRVHGNTLCAGWTKPIQLFPEKYTLPPACILFEGYNKVKTTSYTIIQPSGFRLEIEDNILDAFVTFIHPASKYTGPGTDGVLIRDRISTNIPPKLKVK